MMHRFDMAKSHVTVQQTRRVASAGGGVIHASAPEGLGGALRPLRRGGGEVSAWAYDLSGQVSTVSSGCHRDRSGI